ncbi:MAG: type II toxin-antitoxin system HicB family antitoxin [Bacteroidetes bacterium]|nr:type II toxin-antitoxin system HicB family antitoxin [Bacteroidota bacterium]
MLEYKNYRARVEYIDDARIFHGEVLGTKDVITFQGTTPEEIETAFRDSVDDYLDFCAERGEEPDKPYSGKFVVRMPEMAHRYIAEIARAEDSSINAVVLRAVFELISKETGKSVITGNRHNDPGAGHSEHHASSR